MRKIVISIACLLVLGCASHAADGELSATGKKSAVTANLTGLFGRRGMTQSETALLQMLMTDLQQRRNSSNGPAAAVSSAPAATGTDPMLLLIIMMMMQQRQQQQPAAMPVQAAQHSPAPIVYMLSPQSLPVSGQPLQQLAVAGQPLQQLPVAGQPLQQLPVQGQPLQQLPLQGTPKQQLPVAPQMPPANVSIPWGCPDGRCPAVDFSRQTGRVKVQTASLIRSR